MSDIKWSVLLDAILDQMYKPMPIAITYHQTYEISCTYCTESKAQLVVNISTNFLISGVINFFVK
jgi:hypothetical protein